MKTASRIQQSFSRNSAFVAYLTAGDGGRQRTLDAALALIDGGVNMLEIGMPFSDPIADGPVIQRAAARALARGTTLHDVLWIAERIRERSDVPQVLFSYINPVFSVLQSGFIRDAKSAGIDGLLLVDCPMEESLSVRQQCLQNDLALIYVIAPSTSLVRLQTIDRQALGFLYYACRKGTTGVRDALPEDFPDKMRAIKSAVHLPVAVGFGISNREMADGVLRHADGVVVGSYFVKMLEDGANPSALSASARALHPSSGYAY